jgi:hypothetical protein
MVSIGLSLDLRMMQIEHEEGPKLAKNQSRNMIFLANKTRGMRYREQERVMCSRQHHIHVLISTTRCRRSAFFYYFIVYMLLAIAQSETCFSIVSCESHTKTGSRLTTYMITYKFHLTLVVHEYISSSGYWGIVSIQEHKANPVNAVIEDNRTLMISMLHRLDYQMLNSLPKVRGSMKQAKMSLCLSSAPQMLRSA